MKISRRALLSSLSIPLLGSTVSSDSDVFDEITYTVSSGDLGNDIYGTIEAISKARGPSDKVAIGVRQEESDSQPNDVLVSLITVLPPENSGGQGVYSVRASNTFFYENDFHEVHAAPGFTNEAMVTDSKKDTYAVTFNSGQASWRYHTGTRFSRPLFEQDTQWFWAIEVDDEENFVDRTAGITVIEPPSYNSNSQEQNDFRNLMSVRPLYNDGFKTYKVELLGVSDDEIAAFHEQATGSDPPKWTVDHYDRETVVTGDEGGSVSYDASSLLYSRNDIRISDMRRITETSCVCLKYGGGSLKYDMGDREIKWESEKDSLPEVKDALLGDEMARCLIYDNEIRKSSDNTKVFSADGEILGIKDNRVVVVRRDGRILGLDVIGGFTYFDIPDPIPETAENYWFADSRDGLDTMALNWAEGSDQEITIENRNTAIETTAEIRYDDRRLVTNEIVGTRDSSRIVDYI